jgi:frizzled protein 1/7
MNRFGFQWPENLECSRFPVSGLCVGENSSSTVSSVSTTTHGTTNKVIAGYEYDCPEKYAMERYRLQIGNVLDENCGMPCAGEDALLSASKFPHVRYVVLTAAITCLLSTLFTVLTFLVDMPRFRYPERPIIYLSACYSVIAITYIVGFGVGDQFACTEVVRKEDSVDVRNTQETDRVVVQGTKQASCTVLFIMMYFFYMSSAVWWVVLSVTWFLSAGLKWGQEAIESNSQYFHLAAWAIPAVQTIAVLSTSSVDGDPLSGVCTTGLLGDINAGRGFLLAPLAVCLGLGLAFLLAGFIALCRIRTVMKQEGTRTDKLEKLMVRIGIFGVLYTVPAAVVVGCLVYEQVSRDAWMTNWYEKMCDKYRLPCLQASVGASVPDAQASVGAPVPDVNIFMIKYLMTLIVGITSGFWIWTSKTVSSWGKFYSRLCGQSRPVHANV